jgi:folate-binding Fe-S cluster repair protein YgfZ
MKAAFLPDRGVVKVSGEDARDFLNGLVTTDVTLLQPGLGRFGALLTPQGKITADFLITEAPAGHGGGFLIDAPRALAQNLADKLGFYKLRAKVAVENISDHMGVLAVWDGEPAMKPDLAFADPRLEALGWRILVPVSRMQHRGTARTRIVRVTLEDFSPETGVAVFGGDKQVGTMGSTAGGHGLALVRIDRVADALDAGLSLTAGGLAIRLTDPNDVRTPPKQTVA